MKISRLIYILLILQTSCSLSFDEKSESDKNPVTLTLNYSGNYSIDTATYSIKSLTGNEEYSGSMDSNTETRFVSADIEIPSGYWEVRANLTHQYDETSRSSFTVSTKIAQFYSSDTNENTIVLQDPFGSNYNALDIDADVFDMTNVGHTVNSVGVWLFGMNGLDNYFFQISDEVGSIRKGNFPSIKRGDYTVWMAAENSDHSDWSSYPWQSGLTITMPYDYISLNEYDGFTRYYYKYLQGRYYLNSSTIYNLFHPHTENGSYVSFMDPYMEMGAYDIGSPATFSLDNYPVGENKMINFGLYYNSAAYAAEPLLKLYLKKDTNDINTAVEVEFHEGKMTARSRVDGAETTHEEFSYALPPGTTTYFNLFLREDVLGIYLDPSMDPLFTTRIDSSLPDDLFLHFETVQTLSSMVQVHNLEIENNFDLIPMLNYPTYP